MAPPSHVGQSRAVDPGAPDFSQHVMYTYIVGVTLATNAIKDAYTLVDGPDCVHMKIQFVHGNHDWLSTLLSVSGHHRLANTALHPVQMAKGREDPLRDTLQRMASHPYTGGVLLTSMPMAAVTAVDYERLGREISQETGTPIVTVPGKSLAGDWLDGYEETLVALARRLDLSGGRPGPDKVGIVGYMMDRNEGDHQANLEEIRRILRALGLEPVSIWLEGQSFAELSAIKDAGTVLVFPYGRKAGRWLARRTGARLIECDYPFGLTSVEKWVRMLGREFGRQAESEALIDSELASIVPALEWVIPFVFQNRRAGYVGDPVLARGFVEIMELLGMKLDFVVVTNMPRKSRALEPGALKGAELHEYPRMTELMELLDEKSRDPGFALLVSNNSGMGLCHRTDVATVEFGFPSYYTHHLGRHPFLGFRGFLSFVDTLANAMRHGELDGWTELNRNRRER